MKKPTTPLKNPNPILNKYLHLQSIFIQNKLKVESSNDNLGFINNSFKDPSSHIKKLLSRKDFHSILILRETLEMFPDYNNPNLIDTNLFLYDLTVRIFLKAYFK
jgi:hypothetical protein